MTAPPHQPWHGVVEAGLRWPAVPDEVDLTMIRRFDLVAAEHYVDNPQIVWFAAGASGSYAPDRWTNSEVALVEEISASPPWVASVLRPGWRVQRQMDLAYLAYSVTRALAALPELVGAEMSERGAMVLDARRKAMRQAAAEIGWRPADLRRFAQRQLDFHPATARSVCAWLAASAADECE